MSEERIYVIPLREVKKKARYKRASRAVKVIKDFLKKHMKTESVRIDEDLNKRIWERGAQKPPARIRVRAVKKDDGSVEAFLAE